MTLLYTGASAPNSVQQNPQLSLGGFVSSTVVRNGELNNLFNTVTSYSRGFETRLIVLQNTTSSTIENIKIWVEDEIGSYYTYKLAFVEPAFDNTCNRYYFEQILNGNSLPLQADFNEYYDEVNAETIDELITSSYLGIWIKRELNLPENLYSDNNQDITDQEIEDLTNNYSTIKNEETKLIIEW